MGLFLSAVAGILVWIVLWSLEVKAFDAFMITLAFVIVAVAVRMISPFLPGNRA